MYLVSKLSTHHTQSTPNPWIQLGWSLEIELTAVENVNVQI